MDWARDLPGRILRGDMMIGILSVDDVGLAPKAMRKAWECGIKEALLDLGNWLASPPYGDPDPAGARTAFREAIGAGVPGAKLRYVEFLWFYCRDTATVTEQREAFEMVDALAKDGEDTGRVFYVLGLLTCQGFGAQADPVRACELQTKAAEMGDADAMFEAYIYHEMGMGVEKDSGTAMRYLQRAAEKGHGRGMYNLAAYLATGRGMPKDLVKAAEWYTRAAEAGNVRATLNLAMMYAKGEGVKKNLEQAKQLFDEADYMGLDVSGARASVGL